MAAWHFAGFMRPLRIVPGPVPPLTSLSLALPRFFKSRGFLFPFLSHGVHACSPPLVPQGVETFFVESPLLDKVLCRLGPLMDARCVGYVVPVCPTTGRLLPREKTRVHLCVNRPPLSRPREAAANSRKGKRNNKFCTLFRGNGLVKYFLPFPPYFVDCSFFSLSFPSVSFLLF